MSIEMIKEKLRDIIDPHARALRLIDLAIDADRGDSALSAGDNGWLDHHLASCLRCREARDARREIVIGNSGHGFAAGL